MRSFSHSSCATRRRHLASYAEICLDTHCLLHRSPKGHQMLLVIRSRFPRIANVLSFVSGMIFLAIGIAVGASPTVLILGGGSSVLLSAVRYFGKRHPRLVAGRGTAATR